MTATTMVAELRETFPCFGGEVTVLAGGEDRAGVSRRMRVAHVLALDAHERLTRFEPGSELCLLNADPRTAVPASALLCRFAQTVGWAGRLSGGLVDATCLHAVEAAGYRGHWDEGAGLTADAAIAPSGPLPGDWCTVSAVAGMIIRPPGVRLDSGGLGKGLAADVLAEALARCETFAVVCGGDLRIGGRRPMARTIEVADPLSAGDVLHRFTLTTGAVATSGVTRRAWSGGHHLIDPRTGRPADTGVLQVTAVAPSAVEAEIRAKTALLAGPAAAADHLPDGGVVVDEHGTLVIV